MIYFFNFPRISSVLLLTATMNKIESYAVLKLSQNILFYHLVQFYLNISLLFSISKKFLVCCCLQMLYLEAKAPLLLFKEKAGD